MKEEMDFLSFPDQPWVIYRALIDLRDKKENDPDVRGARKRMTAHPLVKKILAELKYWPGKTMKSHRDTGHLVHKLAFIAELGFTVQNKDVKTVADKILKSTTGEGPFGIVLNIPEHFGGTGKDCLSWMLCDAPTVVYALTLMGLKDHPAVRKATGYLISLVSENGWRCAASPQFGKFHGPGRREDPCPYATLIMMKLLSADPARLKSKEAAIGMETLLGLFRDRKKKNPYLFGIGTDFFKLKAPEVWYDVVHFADVLSRFPAARTDPRMTEIAKQLKNKTFADGGYVPESVWQAWKEWDFGQKKAPSGWLSFLVLRILKRMK